MEPAAVFDACWQGIWEATFDVSPMGVEVLNFTSDFMEAEPQQTILVNLLETPVDAIVIVPAHASVLNPLIRQHVERGVPVITFYSDAPESGRTLFVGPDAFQAGVLAAEVLGKLMGGRGRVASFPGPTMRQVLAERYRGFLHEVAARPGMLVEVACFPSEDREEHLTADMLAAIRGLEGIYVGSHMVVEVARCMEELGLKIPCVGFAHTDETTAYLDRRTVSAIIDGSSYRQGYFAVQKAYEAILRKDGKAPSGIDIPSSVIFASNARQSAGGQSLNEAFDALVQQRTERLSTSQTLLEEAVAKLEKLAQIDGLTGLYNRRKFDELIETEVGRVQRHGELSLLMIDLNLFKEVNDRYGHQAGDEALKAVAHVLTTRCRSTDFSARLGGDEFAVLLPMTDTAGAQVVRDSISQAIAEVSVPVGQDRIGLSLSIGTATLAGRLATVEDLVSLADQDMYRVKHAGKMARSSMARPGQQ
jgi:diguanylate cyclase (GGDEF)-like protein